MSGRLSRAELAERLGVSPNTIWRWEKAGKSPVTPTKVKRTGEVYYTEEDVEILLKWMNEVEAPEPVPA
ncbi:MAG: Helix-turn-helix domain [Sphingomonadales bacterium]|jgi:transcriptional regulator with XRE-family HTH domain|nr:Helix-turn-helix domain [Sphingomonadales bacterium]